VGLELELQLLDAETLRLVDGILPLMAIYPGSPYVKPELIQNTVEIASPVCHDLADLATRVRALVADVQDHAAQLGMRLCGAGTHPFDTRLAIITPGTRYERMCRLLRYYPRTQLAFATHVHVGVATPREMIDVAREFRLLTPLLIALSANSPFWRGFDTGEAAYRHRIIAAGRSYGQAPSFDDVRAFERFYHSAVRAGLLASLRDVHWDIRPRPDLGTVEVRMMDAQSTVGDAIAIAAVIRAAARYLARVPAPARPPGFPKSLSWWFERQNRYAAEFAAVDANVVINDDGDSVALRDQIEVVLETIEEDAARLGDEVHLQSARRLLRDGPGYLRQRAPYHEGHSLEQVTAMLVRTLEYDTSAAGRADELPA
jgi:carboxylate-amine ligase